MSLCYVLVWLLCTHVDHTVFTKTFVSGEWSCWTDFSECSVTCGEGVRKRTRNCVLQGMLADGCEGPSESLEPCYVPCQNTDTGWEGWTDWSACDKDSQKRRTRKCTVERCVGPEVESVPCFETNRIGKHRVQRDPSGGSNTTTMRATVIRLIIYAFVFRRFRRERVERLVVFDVRAVVLGGRVVGVRRVLRAAETAEAEAAEQSSLHHHQTEPVRDRAHEGLPRARETHAVVHQTVDGDGAAARQRHDAEAVQQDGRLRDGHHQTEQPRAGQRARDEGQRLGTREVLLTRETRPRATGRPLVGRAHTLTVIIRMSYTRTRGSLLRPLLSRFVSSRLVIFTGLRLKSFSSAGLFFFLRLSSHVSVTFRFTIEIQGNGVRWISTRQ